MGLYHALIGIIEGAITVLALKLILNVRPDLMDDKVKVNGGNRRDWLMDEKNNN